MQERRRIVRFPYSCRAKYCPTNDPIARDGKLSDVSEKGFKLLARASHQVSERIAASFPLAGDKDTLTATGIVRWGSPAKANNRWHTLGLEWESLDDPSRYRLNSFLKRLARQQRARLDSDTTPRWKASLLARSSWQRAAIAAAAILVAAGFGVWTFGIRRENRQLNLAVQNREMLIGQLEEEGKLMEGELRSSRMRLALTTGEMAQLERKVRRVEGNIQELNGEIGILRESSAQLKTERDQLLSQVSDLEQQGKHLKQRLSVLMELPKIINDAISARTQPLLSAIPESNPAQQPIIANHGFLVRNGRPSPYREPTWIKVHQPLESATDW